MSLGSPWSCIIWDVDGTIVDASAGILQRLTTVLTDLGRTPPAPEDMTAWIGPPLAESFRTNAMLSPDEAEEAVRRYRSMVDPAGMGEEVTLYPGVADLIGDIHAAGVPQATASTKPENQIEGIFAHHGLTDSFAVIGGAHEAAGVIDTKSTVLARTLSRLHALDVDLTRPVLIGDRHHDIDGARDHDVPVIYVTWGFGQEGEEAGAVTVVDDMEQLRALLLTDTNADLDKG